MRDFSYRFTQKQAGLCGLLRYSHHTYEQHEAVETFEPHAHPHTELIYVLNGEGTYTQNNVALQITRGNLVIVNAYTPHSETMSVTRPLDVLFFAVDASAFKTEHAFTLDEMLRTAESRSPYEKPILYTFPDLLSELTELAQVFEQEIETKPPHFEAYLQARFQCLLISVLRLTTLQPIEGLGALSKNARIPTAVAQYLKDSLAIEHSLGELSERFSVSKNHLTILFKQKFGMTPVQYLKKLRIEEAQSLLRESDRSVSDIASLTGFVNATYFARVYKQCTGHTPTEEAKLTYCNDTVIKAKIE